MVLQHHARQQQLTALVPHMLNQLTAQAALTLLLRPLMPLLCSAMLQPLIQVAAPQQQVIAQLIPSISQPAYSQAASL